MAVPSGLLLLIEKKQNTMMKIVNRGYISVKPLKPFIDWVNKIEEEFYIDENTEPNVYLIDEDFFDAGASVHIHYQTALQPA